MERDNRGDVIAMVDEMNRRVELTRDVMGRVIKEKSPGEKEVSYQWGGAGCASCGDGSKLTKITDSAGLPRGDSITICLVKSRQSDANIWEFKYDIMGNPVEMIYPDDSKITQEYDIAGSPKGIASLDASRSLGIEMLPLSKFTNKRDQEIAYTYEMDFVPKGDSITNCLVKPRQSDANAVAGGRIAIRHPFPGGDR